MLATLAMTGIRCGELLGLQVDDLDFERRLIFIRRSAWYGRIQTLKSKASQGALPMPAPLAEMLVSFLKTWKPNALRLLFANQIGRPMSANKVVQRKLWPILDALKIPRCGLHAFRHTHSRLLVEGGAPVSVAQAQLRHADPRITLGIYSHGLEIHSATRSRSWPRFCAQMRLSWDLTVSGFNKLDGVSDGI